MPHPAPERVPRTRRLRAVREQTAKERNARGNAPRPPRTDPARRFERSGAIALICLLVVVVAGLFLRENQELAWGLEHLMPTGGRQALGAAILPVLLGLGAVVGEASVSRGKPYPAWVSGLMAGCASTAFLLAPLPGRYDVGNSLREAVPVFAYCTWGSCLLIVGGAFLVVRRRAGLAADDAHRDRPGIPLVPPGPSGRGLQRARLLVRVAATVAVPVVVLTGLVAVGRERGEPPVQVVEPVVLAVPALAGSPFGQRVSTAELEELAGLQPSLLASELTGNQPLDRGWRVLLLTTAAPGVPEGARVFLTVSELSEDADLDAARAQMAVEVQAEGGEPLPEGWLAAFRQRYGATVLDGHHLVVLEAGEDGDAETARAELMRTAVAALTPERRAAVIAATDPDGR